MVCLLAEAPLGDDYSLWILVQTSMSQLTVQQSYLLCWELLPDRNCKSMGLWYWELMSHPDPVVLPVGTLHSLEWFWVSRRIFVYSHHNTIVFFSKTSVCPSGEVSGHLLENAWREWPEILHADVSWPPSELISLWLQSVDFSNFGAILT